VPLRPARRHQHDFRRDYALHEAQTIGVIDDAGKIGVLAKNANLLVMAAVADLAVERTDNPMLPCSCSPARRVAMPANIRIIESATASENPVTRQYGPDG